MAPGQFLIEFVIPIASVAATVIGALVIKKRRDRKKAEACKTIDVADNHQLRIESLENMVNTLTHSVLVCATEEKIEGQIRKANDRLRLDISQWDENKVSKGEMERHVNDGCTSVLGTLRRELHSESQTALNSLRNDLENKMIDTAKEISADAERDIEVDMSDVRKEINKKIREYDLALTKWVKKQVEDHQPTLRGAFNAAEHDVVQMKVDDVNDQNDDPIELDEEIDP